MCPLLILLISMTMRSISSSYSSSNSENDLSSFETGIIDGEDYPYSESTIDQCGDDYYEGFLKAVCP
jgi:hypothetical protein